MLLIIHIILALGSIVLMAAALAGRLVNRAGDYAWLTKASALSFVGLVGTGTVLVVQSHAAILGACTQGLLYLGGLSAAYMCYRKLATNE